MAQMNINVDATFERDLRRLMRARGLTTKSEAVRLAVHEAAERASRAPDGADLGSWLGLGNEPAPNPRPRFATDDDLWR
jgi:hypothetical protein